MVCVDLMVTLLLDTSIANYFLVEIYEVVQATSQAGFLVGHKSH